MSTTNVVPSAAKGSPTGLSFRFPDPDPWSDHVDGSELLDELSSWIREYVLLSEQAADAVTLWTAATWLVDYLDYAPILAVLSATKRCGKTQLLDLLRTVVRRGCRTSGSGITSAVLFRLNSSDHPTLVIDEAEKLQGPQADHPFIGMLNDGYRRGGKVLRCEEHSYEVREFDAYGFRVLAAIGNLWPTILDRAIIIQLERKPRHIAVRRFVSKEVEREGAEFSRQFHRWAADNGAAVERAAAGSPRPKWLGDRACDNWSGMFAVASVAGGLWPQRALAAARVLDEAFDEQDDTELLVYDIWRVWQIEGFGEAVMSGTLVERLKGLESSPWAEYGNGRALTTHRLALMLRPLGIRPQQNRTAHGQVIRGYWWTDLEPVFRRYPPPEAVQAVQLVQELAAPTRAVPAVPVVPVGAEEGLTSEVPVIAAPQCVEAP